MKLYHTETQEDYNALMVELEGQGYHWVSGLYATSKELEHWKIHGPETVISAAAEVLHYGNIQYYKNEYPDTLIEKYKAKESLDELEDVPNELLGAVVKHLEIWNEKGPSGDYTDINETMYKYGITTIKIKKPTIGSQQLEVSCGFDEDGVFHSTYNYYISNQSTAVANDNRPDVITEGKLSDEVERLFGDAVKTVRTSAKNSDNVNNPAHYTSGGIETLDYIKAKVSDYPSYAVGNIVKYVSRYEHKNGIEDLKKAQFYLNDLIEEMEKGA